MFGTLIGLFITSTAIIVGADSLISQDDGSSFQISEPGKTCQTGPASVATIQGQYLIELVPPTKDAWLINHFTKICESAVRMKVSLKEQARTIIGELRTEVEKKMSNIDPAYLRKRFGRDPHLNYISVSGYENGVPLVVVEELRLDVDSQGNWMPVIVPSPHLSPTKCKPAFHGEDTHAKQLVKGLAGACLASTNDEAITLFQHAVRATMKSGRKPGLIGGHVGGELDVWIISPGDGAKHQRLPQPVP